MTAPWARRASVARCENLRMTLYLREADVAALLSAGDAVEAVEESFRRLARGVVDNRPRTRLPLEDGQYAVMACVDRELGYAGLKSYAWTGTGTPFVVLLFSLDPPTRLEAVIEADTLGQIRTGAASGVAARFLAREGASSARGDRLRLAGGLADRLDPRGGADDRARRRLLPRTRSGSPSSAGSNDCEPAESHRDAADADIVVTVTTSKDPVLRGEWLREGALVCAVGANDPSRRELDNAVLERAAFVCCDSREQSKLESGDLIEPVERGVLDWLEVHELQEVVAGRGERARRPRRTSSSSSRTGSRRGISPPARGWSSSRASAASGSSSSSLPAWPVRRCGDDVVADRVEHLGPLEDTVDLLRRQAVRHVRVLEDVVERAAVVMLAIDVLARRALPSRTAGRGMRAGSARRDSARAPVPRLGEPLGSPGPSTGPLRRQARSVAGHCRFASGIGSPCGSWVG